MLDVFFSMQDAKDIIRPLTDVHPLLGVIGVIGLVVVSYLVVENYRLRKVLMIERDARIEDMRESVIVTKSVNEILGKWVDERSDRAVRWERLERILKTLAKD